MAMVTAWSPSLLSTEDLYFYLGYNEPDLFNLQYRHIPITKEMGEVHYAKSKRSKKRFHL